MFKGACLANHNKDHSVMIYHEPRRIFGAFFLALKTKNILI